MNLNLFLTHRRYAQHNDYRHFRRIVHDAANIGTDAPPPVPNSSTWFTSSNQPNLANLTGATADNVDNDEDLIMEKEITTLKCPITLMTFKEPMTSTKCPHSFEKAAIMEMI